MAQSDHFEVNGTAVGNGTVADETSIYWWIGLLELFVFLFGAPLNLAVFYLVYSSRKWSSVSHEHSRRITEMFVVSMTSADLLFCAVHAPLMFLNFNRELALGSMPCLTLFAVTHASTVASSLSLLWLNFDKFLRLHRPLHHFLYITRSRAVGFIVIGWVASISWGLLFILGPFITFDDQCNIYLHHQSVYVVFATVFFVLPVIASLIISVYVAIVVVEAKPGNIQKRILHYRNRRFYSGDSNTGSGRTDRTSLLTSPPIRRSGQARSFRVHFAIDNNNFDDNKPAESTILSPALASSYRIFQRRRGLSPAQWPPPGAFRALSPSARRMAHIRRISFVFTTTIWSSLTSIPYRVAFIVNSLSKRADRGHESESETEPETASASIATTAYFCLFAIMTLNAAGNPLITILTQRQYSSRLKEIWRKVIAEQKPTRRGPQQRRNAYQDQSLDERLE